MEYNEFRFVFHAKDYARSVRFYQKILGMKPVGAWDRTDGKGAQPGNPPADQSWGAPFICCV